MTNQNHPILEVKNITKEFELKSKKKLTALDDISFKLYSKECLGIVGESGCGKSTLGNIIANLDKPTSGDVFFKGKNIINLKGEELRQNRKNIQMIFQGTTESFNPCMKIGKIISEPILNFKLMNKNKITEEVEKILEMVELPKQFINKYPHQLSGGQKQRIAIARAISLKSDIVICDEVTSALDVSVQKQVVNLLINLQKTYGLSYVFISHDLALVKNISQRIIVMYLGQIMECIDAFSILSNAVHPYTKLLLSSVMFINGKNNNIQIDTINKNSNSYKGCSFNFRCSKCKDICFREKPKMKKLNSNHYVACHLF